MISDTTQPMGRWNRKLAGGALTVALVVHLHAIPTLATTQKADSAQSERARAYYLFSLAQQAQFRSELPEALRYLEEAVRTADSSDLRLELAEVYEVLRIGL